LINQIEHSKQDEEYLSQLIGGLIDKLEKMKDDQMEALRQIIKTFGATKEKHRNTYLLHALAWNRLQAAKRLLALDEDKIALNLKDEWSTCSNTPLILAAKINATETMGRLIASGAKVNKQDYRGFTALHYACLLRNEEAIRMLIDANANIHFKDAFGNLPIDYYQMPIVAADLAYRYGGSPHQPGFLNAVPDKNKRYFATRKRPLSALRWFVPHIIVNHVLNKNGGANEAKNENPLYHAAFISLKRRTPIYRADIYEAMMNYFCDHRPAINQALSNELMPMPGFINPYHEEHYDRHFSALALFDRVSSPFVFNSEENKWEVELQELPQPSESAYFNVINK
jgi:hypothetical protein